MPLCTSNIRHVNNTNNKKCTACNNQASMIIFAITPCTHDNDTHDNDIRQNPQSSDHFTSCIDCINVIQTITIPKYYLQHGIISYYHYFGYNTESILNNTNNRKMIPSVVLSDYGKVYVALTCGFETQWLIVKKHKEKYRYMVPIFFTKRIRRRNTAIKLHYDLELLYKQNPNLIGLYQIDNDCYNDLTPNEAMYLTNHNTMLFNMALQYNMYAKTILYMYNSDNCVFSIIPIDIIYMIIRFSLIL